MEREVGRSLRNIRRIVAGDAKERDRIDEIDALIAEFPGFETLRGLRNTAEDPLIRNSKSLNAKIDAQALALEEANYMVTMLRTRLMYVDKMLVQIDGEQDAKVPLYCVCQQPTYGDMIACDGPQCTIVWYHLTCLGLAVAPKGKWLCPACRKSVGLAKLKRVK